MAGDQREPALCRDRLQPADGRERRPWVAAERRRDGRFAVEVLLEVGRVEGEHVAAPARRPVELDEKALMARRVARRQQGGDAGGYLDVAVGQTPLDPRVVEVYLGR